MRKIKIMLFITFVTLLVVNVPIGFCAPVDDCTSVFFTGLGLVGTTVDRVVTITSVTKVAAGGGLPEHCRVEGTMWPELLFVFKLPTVWNERYYQIGGGGLGGMLYEFNMAPGLVQGYATGGNNQGHDSTKEPGGTFAYPSTANPNWLIKEDDYCFRADHETALLGKTIVQNYYGKSPAKSYWVGGSNGGREGLKEAQVYPADFDGFVVGMPVLHITGETMQDVWNAHAALLGPGAIPLDKLPILANAVYAKCDSVDGLVDGIIEDPRNCSFNALYDLPGCVPDVDASGCFTSAQRVALKKIYDGPRNSSGDQLYPGTPLGGEALMRHMFGGIMSNWAFWVIGMPNLGLDLGGSFWQYMATDPRFANADPEWNWAMYDFDVDPQKLRPDLKTKCDATNPDLSVLADKGGKIIHWHGWADQLVTPFESISYYKNVIKTVPDAEQFYRLYMVPGLTHVGSIGTSDVDWFTPLVNWVEKGQAPDVLIGSRAADPDLGLTARTRPICPYPEVARYLGSGSIDEAANFTCVNVIPTKVKIEPETINLKSNGVFTAFFTLPNYHHKKYRHGKDSFDITVVCEGAPAIKGTANKHGKGFIAKFRTQDLINIIPGDKITFTAYAILDHCGETLAFEGSDIVRVLDKELKPPKPCKNKNKCN
jgi:hypothetical protein